jgi:hypothetical protein
MVRLFVNLGQMERFTPQKLKIYLQETANVANLHVANVEVTRCSSYFEVAPQFAEIVMAKFQKEKFQNRRVQIDYADRPARSGFKSKGFKGRSRSQESFFFNKRKKHQGK